MCVGYRLRQVQVSLQGNSKDKCTAVPRSPCCRASHPRQDAAFLVTVTGNGDCYAQLQIKAESLPLFCSCRKANLTAIFLHPVSLSLWLVQFSCTLSSDISHCSWVQPRGPLPLMGQVPEPPSVIPTQGALCPRLFSPCITSVGEVGGLGLLANQVGPWAGKWAQVSSSRHGPPGLGTQDS